MLSRSPFSGDGKFLPQLTIGIFFVLLPLRHVHITTTRHALNDVPFQNPYVEVLIPSTSECDCIWRQDL